MRTSLVSFAEAALSRNEMKHVTGGYCLAQRPDGGATLFGGDGAAKSAALYAGQNKTHWCCDSCGSASWAKYIQH